MAYHHEQLVEITLGPKGAFEHGNIGALTRRFFGPGCIGYLFIKRLSILYAASQEPGPVRYCRNRIAFLRHKPQRAG